MIKLKNPAEKNIAKSMYTQYLIKQKYYWYPQPNIKAITVYLKIIVNLISKNVNWKLSLETITSKSWSNKTVLNKLTYCSSFPQQAEEIKCIQSLIIYWIKIGFFGFR